MSKIYPDIVEPEKFRENPTRSCPDLYSNNRKPTDVCFFTVFALFFTALFCFIGYCMYFGDINRIIHGYDDCGTVCGKTLKINKNDPYLEKCYERYDDSQKPFGPYNIIGNTGGNYHKYCTDDCNRYFTSYFKFLNRCLQDRSSAEGYVNKIKYFFVAVSEDFELYWQELIYLCAVAIGISMFILLLFRFCVGFIVWIILIGVNAASIFAAIVLWLLWINYDRIPNKYHLKQDKELYLGCAIVATVLSIIIGLVIIFMRKKIELVVQLFKEAGKSISSMPLLLLQPVATCLAFAVTMACAIYFSLWIASAGHLEPKGPNVFHYRKDGWMKAAVVLNVVGVMWMYQFIIGCQHLIVAGAVSKWYFTRDKSQLSSPIFQSSYNLTRYHLGSVAIGSFLLTVIHILRIIVNILQNMLKNEHNSVLICITKTCLCICNCCLSCLEKIVQIFTGNAYVLVAMYGYSFCQAGKKAFANIVAHPFSILAINSVGDFVLFLAKVLVVVVTEAAASYVLKDKGLQYLWVALIVIGILSTCIAHCFITLYEMIIDSIFMCFCEDSQLNDGLSKPYYMSRGLMEYVENSKKIIEAHDERRLFEHQQSRFTGKSFIGDRPVSFAPAEIRNVHM